MLLSKAAAICAPSTITRAVVINTKPWARSVLHSCSCRYRGAPNALSPGIRWSQSVHSRAVSSRCLLRPTGVYKFIFARTRLDSKKSRRDDHNPVLGIYRGFGPQPRPGLVFRRIVVVPVVQYLLVRSDRLLVSHRMFISARRKYPVRLAPTSVDRSRRGDAARPACSTKIVSRMF